MPIIEMGNRPQRTQEQTTGVRPLIPDGKYLARIIWTERKDFKNGNGGYLSIKLALVGGGEKIWEDLNIYHTNEEYREKAKDRLEMIARFGGLKVGPQFDTDSLKGRTYEIEVEQKTETWNGQTRTKNRITRWHRAPENNATHQEQPTAESAPRTLGGW